jgi:methylmalonyl-CoA mutase C-terminal domain/subunit
MKSNEMKSKKIRVLTAKISLDDHYRGIISITQALRDAGMEVIYLGTGQRVSEVVAAAMQEDVDVIGLSFLCGGHVETMRRFMKQMKRQGLESVLVIVGGIIPDRDIPKLKKMGVAEVFPPGTKLEDIVNFVLEEKESYVS